MAASALTFKTFFQYFIYNATSNHLSKNEKIITIPAKIALTILTAGILPALCKYMWSDRKIQILTERYKTIIEQTADPYKNDL